ncbi:crAss001_48 related protein [Limosilactobacillus mucosae]|uniref:crAss001_48 related protein n=1 Tax=Limosilactobacillus mucosae TaxID=97478 RepID=UPI003EB855E1
MNVLDLENERAELALRLDKLIVFLQQKAEQTVDDEQLRLLYQQYAYMQGYMRILNQRIKDLGLE